MDQIRKRDELPQVDPAEQRHLEVIARLHRCADIDFGLRQHLEGAHQILGRELRRERAQSLAFAVSSDFGVVHA